MYTDLSACACERERGAGGFFIILSDNSRDTGRGRYLFRASNMQLAKTCRTILCSTSYPIPDGSVALFISWRPSSELQRRPVRADPFFLFSKVKVKSYPNFKNVLQALTIWICVNNIHNYRSRSK